MNPRLTFLFAESGKSVGRRPGCLGGGRVPSSDGTGPLAHEGDCESWTRRRRCQSECVARSAPRSFASRPVRRLTPSQMSFPTTRSSNFFLFLLRWIEFYLLWSAPLPFFAFHMLPIQHWTLAIFLLKLWISIHPNILLLQLCHFSEEAKLYY